MFSAKCIKAQQELAVLMLQADQYAPETEVHKYLHLRLASFDIATLYELHYQMITLGKVGPSSVKAATPFLLLLSQKHPFWKFNLRNAWGQQKRVSTVGRCFISCIWRALRVCTCREH